MTPKLWRHDLGVTKHVLLFWRPCWVTAMLDISHIGMTCCCFDGSTCYCRPGESRDSLIHFGMNWLKFWSRINYPIAEQTVYYHASIYSMKSYTYIQYWVCLYTSVWKFREMIGIYKFKTINFSYRIEEFVFQLNIELDSTLKLHVMKIFLGTNIL